MAAPDGRRSLAEHGITVPVQLRRRPIGSAVIDDGLAVRLHEIARTRTPLSATGQPPDWASGATATAVTAAGRSYLDRVTHHTRGHRQ